MESTETSNNISKGENLAPILRRLTHQCGVTLKWSSSLGGGVEFLTGDEIGQIHKKAAPLKNNQDSVVTTLSKDTPATKNNTRQHKSKKIPKSKKKFSHSTTKNASNTQHIMKWFANLHVCPLCAQKTCL